jgi:hypothetical protein
METRLKSPLIAILLVSMLVGTVAVAAVPGVRAASVSLNLYGTMMGGWGTSPGSETIPGPQISVNKDDVVTLTLHSEDGIPHKFLLDYNGNLIADAGEPVSPVFTGTTTITFTASLAGTFNYICTIHPGTMHGTWKTVAPPPPTVHDLAVTSVSASPLTVIKGATVQITVTVKNLGTVSETSTVQAFTGASLVGNQSVSLGVGATANAVFSWNTTPVTPGTYLTSGKIIQVTGENNTANNQMNDGTVTVNPLPPGNLKAELVGHSAWPDFHHLAIHSRSSTQTLYGKVANVGPGPVAAKVVFQIFDANTGILKATIESNVATIPVGGIVVVSGAWTAVVGSYSVRGQCWFDTNNDGIFDGSDPGVKIFSFKVVP